MAEQNLRQYGWPIPKHLQTAVATIAPDLEHTFSLAGSTAQGSLSGSGQPPNTVQSDRLAAGQGKLQEVDLGPSAAARIEQAWKRLESGAPAEEPTNRKKDKYGYQWRKSKRRNSEAERREQMVEAVLREAKRML